MGRVSGSARWAVDPSDALPRQAAVPAHRYRSTGASSRHVKALIARTVEDLYPRPSPREGRSTPELTVPQRSRGDQNPCLSEAFLGSAVIGREAGSGSDDQSNRVSAGFEPASLLCEECFPIKLSTRASRILTCRRCTTDKLFPCRLLPFPFRSRPSRKRKCPCRASHPVASPSTRCFPPLVEGKPWELHEEL